MICDDDTNKINLINHMLKCEKRLNERKWPLVIFFIKWHYRNAYKNT